MAGIDAALFSFAQRAFGAGDLDAIKGRLLARVEERAAERAEAVRRLRGEE